MFTTQVDTASWLASMSDLEKQQFPFAVSGAINDSLFDARDAWRENIATVFSDPTQLTLNAVLYKKANKQTLTGELFLRNVASNGTPPSRYLLPEVEGGRRDEKPVEHLLRENGIIGSNEFLIPAKGFPLDAFGNVPGSVITTMLADLQSLRDVSARSTPASRGKRSRAKKVAKRAVYFESAPNLSASQGKHQPLPRGIFQRTRFVGGSAVRMVFAIVEGAPVYRKRFEAVAIADKAFRESFPIHFKERMRQAILSAKIK